MALLFFALNLSAQNAATVEEQFRTGQVNGCSSCPDCQDESMQNFLLINCAPSTCAVIRLIDLETGRCCRVAQVMAGDSLRLTNIPAGKYFARIAYGREWQYEDKGSCKGYFSQSAVYKESKRVFDFRPEERKKYVKYPSFALSLSLTEESAPADAGKQVKDKVISAAEFNR